MPGENNLTSFGFTVKESSKECKAQDPPWSSGPGKAGKLLILKIHGIRKPEKAVGKKCKILIYEIDAGKKKDNDLLASFTAKITKSGDNYCFDMDETKRKGSVKPLPEAEEGNTFQGPADSSNLSGPKKTWRCTYKPHYIPPHFYLDFDNPLKLDVYDEHLIRINKKERERYIFEIGVIIKTDNEVLFNNTDSVNNGTTVDCTNILSYNCMIAMEQFFSDHLEMLNKNDRPVGTHHGNQWKNNFKIEDGDSPQEIEEKKEKKKYYGKLIKAYKTKGTSCIDFVTDVLEQGHGKSNFINDWNSIKRYMKHETGSTLARGLFKAGWLVIGYMADTKNIKDKDKHHKDIYDRCLKGKYGWEENELEITEDGEKKKVIVNDITCVADLVVNHRPTIIFDDGTRPSNVTQATPEQKEKLNKLLKVPFGMLLARRGKHNGLYSKGHVYDAARDGLPDDGDVFEKIRFQEWEWNSGAIVVPPGYWDPKDKTCKVK